MSQKVLSYDLGGTKIAVGVVNSRGRVLEQAREPIALQQGKNAVLDQIATMGKSFLAIHPEIRRIGIASAGPLDPRKGVLLNPTNLVGPDGTWGIVPITQIIKSKLKKPVYLDNDAAAAALAEKWVGAGKKFQNSMILTLGTGLGTGIICNGELVRAGRYLHPEAGHLILRAHDSTAPCGCGNLGCAEAYLSGRSFSRRARQRFANSSLTAREISDLARQHDPRALAAFSEYSEMMAVAIHNYARIYCPEIIIFAGSFAAAADLFLPATQEHLARMLRREKKGLDLLPKLAVSKLENNSGLIGGAYIALKGSRTH